MREELIQREVATVVRPPSVERVEVQPLSTEEASQFLAASVDHRLHALFALGVALELGRANCSPSVGTTWTLKVVSSTSVKACSPCPRWASFSVPRSRISPAVQFRFPQPRRRYSDSPGKSGCRSPCAWTGLDRLRLVYTSLVGRVIEPRCAFVLVTYEIGERSSEG